MVNRARGKRVQQLVTRGIIESTNDSQPMQLLRVQGLADSTLEDAENVQPYGLSARPKTGGECLVLALQGNLEDVVVVQAAGSSKRPRNLAEGEVVLWGDAGAYAKCNSAGELELNGDTDHAVAYAKLAAEFNELNAKFNALVTAFNLHEHLLLNPDPQKPLLTAAPVTPAMPSTADITKTKVPTVKLKGPL